MIRSSQLVPFASVVMATVAVLAHHDDVCIKSQRHCIAVCWINRRLLHSLVRYPRVAYLSLTVSQQCFTSCVNVVNACLCCSKQIQFESENRPFDSLVVLQFFVHCSPSP